MWAGRWLRKRSIAMRGCLSEPTDTGSSPTAGARPFEHRDALSVMESNAFLKSVSLFLQLCIFFLENHKWSLFSVSNLQTAQLCFLSPVSLIIRFHFWNWLHNCLRSSCSCSAFFASILVMFCKWKETAASQARRVLLFFPLNKRYFFQIFQKQPNWKLPASNKTLPVINPTLSETSSSFPALTPVCSGGIA